MRHHPIAVAFILVASTAGPAFASDVSGTAFSLTFRGNLPSAAPDPRGRFTPFAQPNPRSPQAGAMMRLINGRTGLELAQGRFDNGIGGYFFSLPMTADLSRGDVCLVLKSADGRSIPVRGESSGDDGYAFRNPLWERELLRRADLRGLQADLTRAQRLIEAAQKEQREAEGTPLPATPQECQAGAERAEPPRPVAALTPEQANEVSGAVCAVRWLEQLQISRNDLQRFFREASMEADLQGAGAAGSVAEQMPQVRLRIEPVDVPLLKDAAQRGAVFLQHRQGVARLRQITQQCKADVVETAANAVTAWGQERLAARTAPERERQACERRVQRRGELAKQLATGATFVSEVEKRIQNLENAAPPATESTDVGRLSCKEN